ncbi:hypothetical protein F0562_007858 [Nyssa sinensis]|uniref:Myb-like domain-containing protein n=1 Tax=Nyssa sinensis TaxID=561372 RepID=A0A5J5A863_9ASTE|nr:hypothetical protein F0562_007858 [Nyssa sinensis]
MQQQQGGGGGSQYGVSAELTSLVAAADARSLVHHQQQLKLGDPSLGVAEAASPISSRPPAVAHSSGGGDFEELLSVPGGGLPDDDALAGDEADRGGVAGGNRWPRQETLALLKIRSEMDAVFRDATLKGPLWEDVSRKLEQLGYKRSAKKCKEKFENVHKYYKRTKEGRAGRQDGKSYRFFSELEALHSASTSSHVPPQTATTTTNLLVVPVHPSSGIGINNPIPVSSVRMPSPISAAMPAQAQAPSSGGATLIFHPDVSSGGTVPAVPGLATAAPIGISFSSDSPSSSSGSDGLEDDMEEKDEMEVEGEPGNTRKRKRGSPNPGSSSRMMEFFEVLMKQVMQKQEAMQQRFLETIEKREQDRMIREEAWKRQEMARLAREHELMAQERTMSASRDAAIIAFLQKITGQTIQLPQPVTMPAAPPQPPPPPPTSSVLVPLPPSRPLPPTPPSQQQYQKPPQQQQQQQIQHYQQQQQVQQQQQQYHHHHHSQSAEVAKHQSAISSEVVMAVPEQQVPPQEISGGGSFEATSSRWPKTEVLALIRLRSGLESRYQEAGPKGPLWEEISSGMQRMGYKRSAKRCKEKWENINKYFKKVKESNKKRPEDAKTCPYFHELDALYRKKILGNVSASGSSSSLGVTHQQLQPEERMLTDPISTTKRPEERTDVPSLMSSPQTAQVIAPENQDGDNADLQKSNGGLTASLFGEGSCSGTGGAKTPEDTLKEQHQLMADEYDKIEEPDSDNLDQEEEEEEENDEDEDEEAEEETKMAYKIQFQRQNAGSSNGGGNGAPSFLAMVQ